MHDYLRSSSLTAPLLSAPNPPSYTTLFIPLNRAIIALPYKPHRGPAPAPPGMPSIEVDEREAQKYLERWLARHIVAGEVDESSANQYKTMEDGRLVWFEKAAEGVKVMPGGIDIVDVITV